MYKRIQRAKVAVEAAIKNGETSQAVLAKIASQAGFSGMGILGSLLGVVVVLVVMTRAIPVLWPLAANSTAIDAMTGTDAGTTTVQAFWPIILLLVGLGLAIGLIVFALRKFGLMGMGVGD